MPFQPGNKLGKGNPLAAAVNELRVRVIDSLKVDGGVEECVSILFGIAADTSADAMARIAAIKELLNRSVGKAEDTLNIHHQHSAPTLEQMIERLLALGAPVENWPLRAQEAYRKQIESKVVD